MAAATRRETSEESAGATVAGRAARARGPVLLARRHRALHQSAQDLRALRGLVPLRRGGPRRTSTCRCGTRPSTSATATRASTTRCGASSTGCRRSPASTCIARRSSSPPCIAQDAEQKFGAKGRVHFNVGGSQAVEDSLKLVRNAKNGKSLMFAFEGGYHGRTLGASAITSSYRYRRRYGHFGDRAQFVPFPYHFRGPKGMSKEEYGSHCVQQFERLFESEYNGVWDPKAGEAEYAAFYVEPIQGTGGYVIPPQELLHRAEEGARPARHPAGRRRDPDGLLSHRQAVVDRALRREARRHRVRQGDHQRPQSAGRHLGARGADQPAGLPAGLHALDLQRQSDGHRASRSRP